MKQHVFKRTRTVKGKSIKAKTYSGRYRLSGESRDTEIALGVTDKQVAESKLATIVLQSEKERQGLAAPKRQIDTVQMSLQLVTREWVLDLAAKGRTPNYCNTMEKFMGVLMRGCNWSKVGDIQPESFIRWRGTTQNKAPKTLNEYLGSVKTLLNWLVNSGRLPANPLASVEKVETRGRTVRNRRAFLHDEFLSLLDVAEPSRAVVYAVAYYTGLRRAEIGSLCWGDFNLTSASPSVTIHASNAKNKTSATLPLHPDLRDMLQQYFEDSGSPDSSVKALKVPPRLRAFYADLKAAGIPKIDARGKRLDFHSLRHSCATRLASQNVPLPVAMKIMRHSDPKLTAQAYVDSSHLPLADAIGLLPGMPNRKQWSPDSSLDLVPEGHLVSTPVAINAEESQSQVPLDEVVRRVLASLGALGQMAPALGIEPRT